jgi:nicotinamide-nucleotide amidase
MQEVNASIITIGDELLIGQTIDTNSAFISQQLNSIGIWVKKRIAIGDVKKDILKTLEEQTKEADVIILTGGLGPTADDITKPALCEYFNSHLIVNDEALENVKRIFNRFNRPLTERNLKQAEVPHNCIVLQNSRGTAPGMWFTFSNNNSEALKSTNSRIYISLPGVPYEMQGLMENVVLPELKKQFRLPVIIHRTLVTIGLGESYVADKLQHLENKLPQHIKLAYLPAYGMVKLRLSGKGSDESVLNKEVESFADEIKSLVTEWLIAERDMTLVEVVSDLLHKSSKSIATAESCTGGYLAHLITSLPGASKIYKGSAVSYANEIKVKGLGVKASTLNHYGAVSEETVVEMVNGVLEKYDADYAVATSGVMGPDGGTTEKPVGTVWIAVASRNNVFASKQFAHLDRKRNIELTGQIALNMLRRFILEQELK